LNETVLLLIDDTTKAIRKLSHHTLAEQIKNFPQTTLSCGGGIQSFNLPFLEITSK